MIKNIVKDIEFLKKPSTDLEKDEMYVVEDLIHTLKFNSYRCVGMAANMIGYSKNAIVILQENNQVLPMINPKIISRKNSYKAVEGCLSLDGEREAIRYKEIRVEYLDTNFNKQVRKFKGFDAQIIQHEVDHLFGIII